MPLEIESFGDVPGGLPAYHRNFLRKLRDAVEILAGNRHSQTDTTDPPRSQAVTFGTIDDVFDEKFPPSKTAAALALLAMGAANQKIFMNAAGIAPEWAAGMRIISFGRDLTAGSGTQSITGWGFTPSGMVLFATSTNGGHCGSVGVSNGASSLCVINTAGGASLNYYKSSFGIYIVSTYDSNYARATIAATADGIDVAWTIGGTMTDSGVVYGFAWR